MDVVLVTLMSTNEKNRKQREGPDESGLVAGNAARDPKEQTCRADLPEEERQEECGERGRGSDVPGAAPPRVRDVEGKRPAED